MPCQHMASSHSQASGESHCSMEQARDRYTPPDKRQGKKPGKNHRAKQRPGKNHRAEKTPGKKTLQKCQPTGQKSPGKQKTPGKKPCKSANPPGKRPDKKTGQKKHRAKNPCKNASCGGNMCDTKVAVWERGPRGCAQSCAQSSNPKGGKTLCLCGRLVLQQTLV